MANIDEHRNTLVLRMSFRNLDFSRCFFSSSASSTKQAFFLFSLYAPFRIDTLTLANIGITCSFLHNFYKSDVGNQFFKLRRSMGMI